MSERDKWELKRFALNNRDVTVDLRKIDSPSFHKLILSILVYTFFSRMFDLMLPPVAKHSIAVA